MYGPGGGVRKFIIRISPIVGRRSRMTYSLFLPLRFCSRAQLAFRFSFFIKLDLEDIDASEVLFPAKSKQTLDWELMNKLCEQNKDFETFIDDVTKDFKVKTIHKVQYDKVLEDMEGYVESILGKS